jgi:hypothetical protein
MNDVRLYNEKLELTEQIDMEERVAAIIFHNYKVTTDEETAAILGRDITREVLMHFRPDLFVKAT